jgi:hypothetical protein
VIGSGVRMRCCRMQRTAWKAMKLPAFMSWMPGPCAFSPFTL